MERELSLVVDVVVVCLTMSTVTLEGVVVDGDLDFFFFFLEEEEEDFRAGSVDDV